MTGINHAMAVQVIADAEQIGKLAAKIDLDLGLYLDPNSELWSEANAADMAAAFAAVKQARDELALVAKMAETVACDALDTETVVVDGVEYRRRSTPKRAFTPERRGELRDVMVRHVARKVALSPLTGELDDDRARIAHEAIRELDRWQTIDAAKFKTTTLKAEGVDLDEFAETEWSHRVEARPL